MACPSPEGRCTLAWINQNLSACSPDTATVCLTPLPSPPSQPPALPPVTTDSGVAYGAILSVCCDVIIAIGLGLQKTGHMRVMKQPEEERKTVFFQPVWVLGLVCMISGEVGNLLAYGDPLTPTAVVTSVGCIGVVANLVIATMFLKEPFRSRDVLGAAFVVLGVILVTIFAPNNAEPLTGEQLNSYLVQWGAIAIYIVYGFAIAYLYFAVKKIGHTHVVWYLLLSSLIGAFTVMSSKPVATFLMLSIEGLSTGHFDDMLEPSITSAAACAAENADGTGGFGLGTEWLPLAGSDARVLVNSTHGCYFEGLGQLDQPTFWVAIVILIVTAISQVKYLNDAMTLFSNSEVIPVHYTLFTLSSMTGSIIMYQEWDVRVVDGCTQWWTLHLFVDGIASTFLGVYFITTRRVVIDPDNPESITEALVQLQTESSTLFERPEQDDPKVDGVQLVLGTHHPPPPANTLSMVGAEPRTPSAAAATSGGASTPWSKESSEGVQSPAQSPAPPKPAGSDTSLMGLTRQATRDIVMGERSGSALRASQCSQGSQSSAGQGSATGLLAPAGGEAAASAASSTRQSTASQEDAPRGRASRVSFADDPFGAVTALLPRGFDARAPDRSSRASNVISFLGALSGGQQAMFLYDAEDKRTQDAAVAARRAAARASAARAAEVDWFPAALTIGIGSRHSQARGRSSSSATASVEAGAAGHRSRSASTPHAPYKSACSVSQPARASCTGMLPGIGEAAIARGEQPPAR